MNWRALEAAVDGTVGAAFGEPVRISFMKNGATDPGRPMVDIHAVLHTGGDDAKPMGASQENYRTRLSAGQAELFLDRATYDGPMPAPGDRVRANERDGRPWWEVAAPISDRYSNLIVLSLNQL